MGHTCGASGKGLRVAAVLIAPGVALAKRRKEAYKKGERRSLLVTGIDAGTARLPPYVYDCHI